MTAVCHGVAALVNVKDQNGKNIISGRTVTCFSNAEEEAVGGTHQIPFLVEARLREVPSDSSQVLMHSWVESLKRIVRISGLMFVLMGSLLLVPILLVPQASQMLS